MKKVVSVLILALAVSCAFVSCKSKEQKELEAATKAATKAYGDAVDAAKALGF
jgi:hypothetical protein